MTRLDPLHGDTQPTTGSTAIEGTDLRIGDVIDGKYRVDRLLGAGGMGVVLVATHLILRQQVALKLLLPTSLEREVVVARFDREARAAAMLRSAHVTRVIDVGRLPSGAPYMVMELLDGADLETVAEESGPLAIETAVHYVLQACEALAEAHALGIVHRDLKPENLFLTRSVDGSPLVKVLDFGISKTTYDAADIALTRTTDVIGSPLYMSPEQMRSTRDADARSDLWALGAILYRLLAGRTPFDGETMPELCTRVLLDAHAPLRSLRPDVPVGLERVVDRCLAKNPAERYGNVSELASALDPFVTHHSIRAAQRVASAAARPASAASPAYATRSVAPRGGTTNGAVTAGATDGTRKRFPWSIPIVVALVSAAAAGAFVWRTKPGAVRHEGGGHTASAAPVASAIASSDASVAPPDVVSTPVASTAAGGMARGDAGVAPASSASVLRVAPKRGIPKKKAPIDEDDGPDLRK